MRALMVALLLAPLAALAGPTAGPASRLVWDYDPAYLDQIDGFRIYCADVLVWEGTAQEVTLGDVPMQIGRQDCFAKAWNAVDESLPSNLVEVKYVTARPVQPNNLRDEPPADPNPTGGN